NSLHLPGRFSSGELKHSIRELCSKLPHRRVIEKVQGLRRDQRFAPLQAIWIHGRQIETLQQRRWLLPKLLDVNAAAFARQDQSVRACFDRLGSTTPILIELTSDPQERIAQFLSFHPAQWHPRQQTIAWIELFVSRRDR